MTSVRVGPSEFKPITEPVLSRTIVGRQNEAKVREALRGEQGVGYAGVN